MDDLKNFTERSVIVADSKQVSCEVDGETVILHLKDGIYYGLNAVGTHIWSLIQQPRSVETILEVLSSEYEVEPEVCRRDLLALLEELASHGLVEVRDEMVG